MRARPRKTTTQVETESRLLRLISGFVVRRRPLVVVVIITSEKEEVYDFCS